MFEFDQFGEGTRHLAEMIAASAAFSVAGGGDTLAAVDKYGVRERKSPTCRPAAARSSSSSKAGPCRRSMRCARVTRM